MQGMPPPPPPPSGAQGSNGADEGFTSDELKTQLDAIGESDAKRATLINKVLNNFSAADVDGNGKVIYTGVGFRKGHEEELAEMIDKALGA